MDERGQAHVVAVLALGIAAVVLMGLLARQEQLLGAARAERTGEAAAQAAGAIVADEHLALVTSLRDARGAPRDPTAAELARFLADPGLTERALAAAHAVAREDGGLAPFAVTLTDAGPAIEVAIDAGRWYRVAVEKVSCCRR